MSNSIGVAVIGAGMAGRSHAHAYRTAQTVFGTDAPPVRLVAVADLNEEFARHTAQRYGFERYETDWRRLVDAPDVDAVSIVVANSLHREIAEALLGAGKHVLCEKPLAPSVADAEAMVRAAERAGKVAACGFTFRRNPAISAIGQQVKDGALGEVLQFEGRYLCDYGASPEAPMSWRYQGAPGSGALADIGSHLIDLAEHLCGPIVSVRGAALPTVIKERPIPLGAALGHAAGVAVSDQREPVTNDDVAAFVVEFASGASGTFSISRVALGHPNDLSFSIYGTHAAARFDQSSPGEFGYIDTTPSPATNGWRRVLAGPAHPYIAEALSMPFPGVGYGQQEYFTFQARAFLDQIAGLDRLPAQATFADGLRNLTVEEAVVTAATSGAAAPVPAIGAAAEAEVG